MAKAIQSIMPKSTYISSKVDPMNQKSKHRRPQMHTTNQPSRPPNTPNNNLSPHPPDIPSKRSLRKNSLNINTGIPTNTDQNRRRGKQIKNHQPERRSNATERRGALDAGDEGERGTEETD